MGYIFAFIIIFIVIACIGLLFSMLWPLLIIFVVIMAISRVVTNLKNKEGSNSTTYQDNQSYHEPSLDDGVIDVEFSEEDISEK